LRTINALFAIAEYIFLCYLNLVMKERKRKWVGQGTHQRSGGKNCIGGAW